MFAITKMQLEQYNAERQKVEEALGGLVRQLAEMGLDVHDGETEIINERAERVATQLTMAYDILLNTDDLLFNEAALPWSRKYEPSDPVLTRHSNKTHEANATKLAAERFVSLRDTLDTARIEMCQCLELAFRSDVAKRHPEKVRELQEWSQLLGSVEGHIAMVGEEVFNPSANAA